MSEREAVETGTSSSPWGKQTGCSQRSRTHCSNERELCWLRSVFCLLCWAGTAPTTAPLALLEKGGERPPCSPPPKHSVSLSSAPRCRDFPFPLPQPQGSLALSTRTRALHGQDSISVCHWALWPDHTACVASGAMLGVGEKHCLHGFLLHNPPRPRFARARISAGGYIVGLAVSLMQVQACCVCEGHAEGGEGWNI